MLVEVSAHLVAKNPLDQREIVIDQRRRLGRVGALLDLVPQVDQEPQVGAQLFFRGAVGRGTDNKSAGRLATLMDQNPLQPVPLLVRGDLAADAHVGHRRHETRNRPGRAMWLVMRAPFLAIGSLAIWTRISCPGFSRSLMTGRSVVCAERREGPRRSCVPRWLRPWPVRPRRRAAATLAARCRFPSAAGACAFGRLLFLVLVCLRSSPLFRRSLSDAVIEVGLLQHFTQSAVTDFRG